MFTFGVFKCKSLTIVEWHPWADTQSGKYLHNTNRLLTFFPITLSQVDREVFQIHMKYWTESRYETPTVLYIKPDIKAIWVERETPERNSSTAERTSPHWRVESEPCECSEQGQLVPCSQKALWERTGIRAMGCVIRMGPDRCHCWRQFLRIWHYCFLTFISKHLTFTSKQVNRGLSFSHVSFSLLFLSTNKAQRIFWRLKES